MSTDPKTFTSALNRQLWIWRSGSLLGSLFRVLRLAAVALFGAMLADYLLALSPLALTAVDLLVAAGLAFAVLWELIDCAALDARETAERADRLLGNPRQAILTAFELQAAPLKPEETWRQFLVARSLRDGAAALGALRPARAFPGRAVWQQFKWLALVAGPIGALLLWQPEPARVVLSRLRHPQGDLPPYSIYRFRVSPQPARVVYGGSVELSAEITGGPVRQPVGLRVRKGDSVDQTLCFRQSEKTFSQRLEKVVDPVEFCFVLGRARSPWQPVELLLRPKVAMLKLGLEPPAYTGLPTTETVMSQETIEGYKGSKARLQLTSNRPLSRGVLRLVPLNGVDEPQAVVGLKQGLHTVSFEWEVRLPSRVEIRVEDVQGTPMAEPLQLTQKILPDRPPEVAIHSPAPYALATPSATVSVRGTASDDLALRGVAMVRTIAGYRDRALPLGPSVAHKQFAVERDLDLRQAGVLPGQVIELFLEARDFNPDRTGVGSSEMVRIEIISEEEYAETLRANETLEQFAERYRMVQEHFEAFEKTIDDLIKETQKPQPDRSRIDALLEQSRQQNQQAQRFFKQLAAEFRNYKLEEGWQQILEDFAARLEGHANLLEGMNAGNAKLGEVLGRLQRDLQLDAQRLGEQMELTEEFLKAGRIMEMAAQFMEILNRQRDLVRRLQRQPSEDPGGLPQYGTRQAEIRRDLSDFADNLKKAAETLFETGEFEELRASSLDFAEKLRGCGADALMRQAAEAAQKENGSDTFRTARLAKEKLEEFLSQCESSPFGGLCRGKMKFKVQDELRDSLSQLLASLMSGRSGRKGGQGTGSVPGGGKGDADSGYSVPSYTRLNTPLLGPARSQFMPGGQAKGSRGQGGPGGPAPARPERVDPASVQAGQDVSGLGRSPELAPEKYRKALKKYFSQPEAKP